MPCVISLISIGAYVAVQCGVVMLSDDKCPVLAADCRDISLVSQSPRLQLVVVFV